MLRKIPRLTILLFIVSLFFVHPAFSQDMIYETSGGALFKDISKSTKGFKSREIFEVFNKIPFINSPKGYDVQEGSNVFFTPEKNVYQAFLSIGFPRYYRYKKGKLEKQQEFSHIYLYVNDLDKITEQRGSLFAEETGIFNLPYFFSDTPTINYTQINGATVGVSNTWNNFGLYILNPLQTPLFKPLSKEVFTRFWISKLQLELNVEQERLKETKENLKKFSADPALHSLIADTKTNIKITELWIDYYKERKFYYEQKLESMSDREKKDAAYGCDPKNQPLAQVKGRIVDKLTGFLAGELADDIKEAKAYPIFQYNTSFFNPKLPKSAMQLLIIQHASKRATNNEFLARMQDEVYPLIDFNALTVLMYK